MRGGGVKILSMNRELTRARMMNRHAGMNVKTMVKNYIRQQGMDGLCNDECGCSLDDFAPCGDGPFPECEMARKLIKPKFGELRHPVTNEIISCSDFEPGDQIFVRA